MSDLANEGKVIVLGNDNVIHKNYYENIKKQLIDLLADYHKTNPLKLGMLKEEVRSKLFSGNRSKSIDALMDKFAENEIVKIKGKFISLYDFEIIFSQTHKKIKTELELIYLQSQYSTPRFEDIINDMEFEKSDIEQVFSAMLGDTLVRLSQGIVFHVELYESAKMKLVDYIKKNGSITLAQFRDVLKTSRKYAVALLEDFDNEKVTKRIGEKRVLY